MKAFHAHPQDGEKQAREPLFHIVKRGTVDRKWPYLVRLYGILAALVVCAVLSAIVTGDSPFGIFGAMFKGSFGSLRIFLSLLSDMAILLCISLAVTPAFKMRFWNIGAEGQVLVGGIATAACMIYPSARAISAILLAIIGRANDVPSI